MGSKYKTKFPMARIKKIMQMDEEIGKVAQGTPIVICTHRSLQPLLMSGAAKALEIFLQDLINKANSQIKAESTRLSRSVIKRLAVTYDEYDFLRELLKDVPEEEEGTQSFVATPNSSKRKASASPNLSKPADNARGGGGGEGGEDDEDDDDPSASDSNGEQKKAKKIEGKKHRSRINISDLVSSDTGDDQSTFDRL